MIRTLFAYLLWTRQLHSIYGPVIFIGVVTSLVAMLLSDMLRPLAIAIAVSIAIVEVTRRVEKAPPRRREEPQMLTLKQSLELYERTRTVPGPVLTLSPMPRRYYTLGIMAILVALPLLAAAASFVGGVPTGLIFAIAWGALFVISWRDGDKMLAMAIAIASGRRTDGAWLRDNGMTPFAACSATAVFGMPFVTLAMIVEHRLDVEPITRFAFAIVLLTIGVCIPPVAHRIGQRAGFEPFRLYIGKATGTLAHVAHVTAMRRGANLILGVRDAAKHIVAIGGTGEGKTANVITWIALQAMKLGVGVWAFDVKGDVWEDMERLAHASGRELLHIGIGGLPFNVLDGLEPREVGATVGFLLRAQGEQQGFFWKQAADRVTQALYVLRALDKYDLYWLDKYIAEEDFRREANDEARDLADACQDPSTRQTILAAVAYWQRRSNTVGQDGQGAGQQAGVEGTISNVIGDFSSPDLRDAFCNPRTEFRVADVIDGKCFVLSAPPELGEAAQTVAHLAKTRLYKALLDKTRGALNPVVVLMDEYQLIASEADLRTFDIARSKNVIGVAATQSVNAMISAFGGQHAKAFRLLANLSNKLFLSTTDPDTLRFIREIGGAANNEYETQSESREHGIARGQSVGTHRHLLQIMDEQRMRDLGPNEAIAWFRDDRRSYDDVITMPFVTTG